MPAPATARMCIKLMDLGVEDHRARDFLSALELTRSLLRGLGLPAAEVKRLLETFKRQDEKRLYQDYQYYTDLEKVRANAQTQAKELEELFARDIDELDAEEEARASPPRGEKAEDRTAQLGRMRERAHMPGAFQDLERSRSEASPPACRRRRGRAASSCCRR